VVELHGDESGGDGVGEVADVGEEAVVVVWGEADDVHADGLPEAFDGGEGGSAGAWGGGSDAGGILEEVGAGEFDAAFFAAGHGVAGDEADLAGEDLFGQADDGAFGAADVCDDGAGWESWGDLAEYVLEDADGGAEDDQIGGGDSGGGVENEAVDSADIHRVPEC